jgi:citrate lyase subunit beta/citryl-CoA lyase
MRSVLYMPALNERFLEKAPGLGADVLTIDLEDTVPAAEKRRARGMAAAGIAGASAGGARVYVRVNGWDTGLTEDDLASVVRPGLSGVALPKVGEPADVQRLDEAIGGLEREHGIAPGTVRIAVLLETARGVVNAYACCGASPRVSAAFFGAIDYCADMGIRFTDEGAEQSYARAAVAVAAHAAGVRALDGPYPNYRDMEGFARSTEAGIRMGYEGRLLIHPCQIEPLHRLHRPDEAALAYAEQVVRVFEQEGLGQGRAAVSLDGKLIDMPVYTDALRVLRAAREE